MKKFCLVLSFFFLLLLFPVSACRAEKAGTSYFISCEYDGENKLTCSEKFVWLNDTGEEISALRFNLYPNAYRKGATYSPVSEVYQKSAYYDGASYGQMTIEKVEGCASWKIAGEDENILSVDLEKSVKKGKSVAIDIFFTVTLAKVNHRTGVSESTVNICNFYPILCAYDGGFYDCIYYSDGDPFYSNCARYEVSLTVPERYTAVSTGEICSKEKKDGKTIYLLSADKVRDFAIVLGENFKCESTVVRETTIEYYYTKDEKPQESLTAAAESFDYFSEKFGGYPYKKYAIVQAGFCFGGMEYPNLSLVSSAIAGSMEHYTIVHETAHQWWYGVVGNNECEYAWMDEGLSEYSAALFFGEFPAYGYETKKLVASAKSAYHVFYGTYKQIFGEADTGMNRNLSRFISEYEYANIAYNKGMVLFDTLKEGIGDKKFFSGLREYYKKYAFCNAKPQDLYECFRKTGVDTDGLFASFVEGKAVL